MVSGYARRGTNDLDIQPVAIQSVDLVGRTAMVLTRVKTMISVDTAFSTGDTTVTPAVGEQWYIERFDGVWRLKGRIPYNDPTLLVEAKEGQVGVGSGRGPVELHGTEINAHGPINLATYSTAERPPASDYPAGAAIYDTTLSQPVYSDGAVWTFESGTGVELSDTDDLPEGSTNKYFTDSRVTTAMASTVSGFTSDISDLADDISGLNAALLGKADATHTHTLSDVTDLNTSLSAIDTRLDTLEAATPEVLTKPITLKYGFGQSQIGHPSYAGFAEADIRAILQGIKDIGASMVRFIAWWGTIEQTTVGGTRTWTGMDRALDLCEEYGIEPLVCITTPGPPSGTQTVTAFANLCGAIAARYGSAGTGQLKNYQVWNEYDHPGAVTAPFSTGASNYNAILEAAAPAIRTADPAAYIITCGMAATSATAGGIAPQTFLAAMYTDNPSIGDYFDALGFHWYAHNYGFTVWQEPTLTQDYYVELTGCHTTLVANGDGAKPVWVTEMGYPEGNVAAGDPTPFRRALWLAEQVEMLVDLSWVDRFFVYNYRNTAADQSVIDNRYGSTEFDLTKRQSWYFLQSINAAVPAMSKPGARRYTTTVGTGSATSFTITHNLGERYCTLNLALESTGQAVNPSTITYTSTTALTFTMSSAPASNGLRVTVLA